jgi:hypothetical protein
MFGIEITTKIGCRNACIYCPQETLIKAYRMRSDILEMSFDTFKICLDKVPSEVPVHFSGMCEPWLNPECTNMVLYAYMKGHKIHVYTTLVNMNLSDIEALKTCSYETFCIHLPSENNSEDINIDDKYLKVLEAISKSGINVSYQTHSGMAPLPVRLKVGRDIPILGMHTRAANLKNVNIPSPNKKKGRIGCVRSFDLFELLPNGDVALCCMDYGLKHVLGNLILGDCDSLYRSSEFLKVKRGITDESLDILCRYCDAFVLDVDFTAKFYNHYIMCRLKNIRNLEDIPKFIKDCVLFCISSLQKKMRPMRWLMHRVKSRLSSLFYRISTNGFFRTVKEIAQKHIRIPER